MHKRTIHVFGKFSWALCSTTNSRLKVHSSLRRTSQVSWVYCLNNIFTSKKQEQFSRQKCKTLMSQHIIYFIVGMWSHLQASRKCRLFYWLADSSLFTIHFTMPKRVKGCCWELSLRLYLIHHAWELQICGILLKSLSYVLEFNAKMVSDHMFMALVSIFFFCRTRTNRQKTNCARCEVLFSLTQ